MVLVCLYLLMLVVLNAAILTWHKWHARPVEATTILTDQLRTLTPEALSEMTLTDTSAIEPGSAQTLIPALDDNTFPPQTAPVDNVPTETSPDQTGVVLIPFDRDLVLADSEQRIHDDFTIPDAMKERVGFWFDVYTKWNEHQRVIHNARYPWIIYRVVDVTDIINSKTPTRRWLRNVKADKFVDAEAAQIRKALKSVAARRNLKALNPYEQDVVNALQKLGGRVQARARASIGETRIQMGQRNFFEQGLKISPRYLPEMERIFASKKLPIELTRLPLVESSFNKFATSKDGAAGIWQFMDGIGGKFMLINDHIDERRSPFKATEAAARLLKENHLILYRKWPLALTAYNHGPGGVRQAVKAMGTKDLERIVGKYRTKMFGFASSNFYSSFLAALHAQTYNDKIWSGIEKETPLEFHVVKLPRAYRITTLMKLTGLDQKQVLLYNPDLNKIVSAKGMVPRGFRFHIPSEMKSQAERVLAQRMVKDVNHAALSKSGHRVKL